MTKQQILATVSAIHQKHTGNLLLNESVEVVHPQATIVDLPVKGVDTHYPASPLRAGQNIGRRLEEIHLHR